MARLVNGARGCALRDRRCFVRLEPEMSQCQYGSTGKDFVRAAGAGAGREGARPEREAGPGTIGIGRNRSAPADEASPIPATALTRRGPRPKYSAQT